MLTNATTFLGQNSQDRPEEIERMLRWVKIRPHWGKTVLSCWEPPQRTSSQTTCSQLSVLTSPWPMGGQRDLGSRPIGNGATPLTHNKTWVPDLASEPEARNPSWIASWAGFEAARTPSETSAALEREPGLRKCEVTLATRGSQRGEKPELQVSPLRLAWQTEASLERPISHIASRGQTWGQHSMFKKESYRRFSNFENSNHQKHTKGVKVCWHKWTLKQDTLLLPKSCCIL